MTQKDWYFFCFVLTVIAAFIFWGMALIIYRRNRKNPLNTMLALSFVFAGLWVPFGFIEKIFSPPNDALTLWSYRFAYAFGNPALLFLFLFALTLYLGRKPTRSLLYGAYLLGAIVILLSLSSWGIEKAVYNGNKLEVFSGPLYPILNIIYIICAIGIIYLLVRKWYLSSGIDRARTNVILLGVGFVLPMAILCNIAIPSISGNAISTNFTFVVGALVPPVLMFYAIVRLRLLEIRLIIRKSGVTLIGAAIFSMPLVALLLVSYSLGINRAVEMILALILLLGMVWIYPVVWLKIQKLSARVFFSSLYDTNHVQENVASTLAATVNQSDNVLIVLDTLLEEIGLDRTEMWILPQILTDKEMCFARYRGKDDLVSQQLIRDMIFPDWLSGIDKTMVTEELERWPKTQEEETLGRVLRQYGFSACIPAKTDRQIVGYIFVGEKYNQRALSSTDIDLIEKIGVRLALYLDNYALSSELGLRLEELSKADSFKQEVILITAHEFRTPITVINGLTEILNSHWPDIEEEKKVKCMADMHKASRRLCELSEEVYLLSKYYAGEVSPQLSLINIEMLLEKLSSSCPETEKNRLIIDMATNNEVLSSDLKYLFIIMKQVMENALRFSEVSQPVIVQVLDDKQDRERILITIQDFGKGLAQEEIEHIFKPFTFLEDVNYHSKGMGLGLYLVNILSGLMDIRVDIDSKLGEGTTVLLNIPIKTSP